MAGRRRALIVANGEYDNAGLQRLSSPAADADALAEVLSDRAISDFEVKVVRNETAHAVQAEIEDLLAEGKPDDVLLLHFSCHGLKSDSGELFFAARNTRPDRLASTAVPAGFVQRCMRVSRSRSVVLLLDCCYGGAFGQGVVVRASGDANVLDSFPGGGSGSGSGSGSGGRGRAVITASNSIEYAFEGDRLADSHVARTSVFTAALVEGLRTGAADRDEDGWIALGELYEYLFDRVRERNPKQTPSRDIEMQGELYLARSKRRRIRPLPIPADLQAAIMAENMFTRLGAVAELQNRLTSDNVPVALGAYEALGSIASTDIQAVADAARSARQEAAVRPDADVLHFGADTTAKQQVRLLGPPVARECTFTPSHDWIHLSASEGSAEVTVTTAESGKRQGKIVVSGPTGGAVITVEAEAAPPQEAIAWPEAPDTEPIAALAAEPESEAAESEPEPDPEPETGQANQPEQVPVASSGHGVVSRSDPAFLITGIVAIAGGLSALASLLFEYHYGYYESYALTGARAGMEWYVAVLALLAVLAGGVVAVPWIRQRIGYGWLAGIGAAALWGLLVMYDAEKSYTAADGSHHLAAGFGFLFTGLLMVLFAGASTFWVLRRDPAERVGLRMPRDVFAWIAIALGVAGAVAVLKQYSVASDAYSSKFEGAWRDLLFLAVLAIAVPILSTVIQPRFGLQLLGGWACGGIAVLIGLAKTKPNENEVSLIPLILFAVSLVLLVVVAAVRAKRGVAGKRRNQPIRRRS